MNRRTLPTDIKIGILIAGVALAALLAWVRFVPAAAAGQSAQAQVQAPKPVITNQYVAIGWNNLGMHCISPTFNQMAILPPYNTMMVQVIQRGEPPVVVTANLSIRFSVQHNTRVAGKPGSDFWTFCPQLFGTQIPLGVGLTGTGLTGTMTAQGDHFEAVGIPVLPYDDRKKWSPYQVAEVSVRNARGKQIASTRVVLPVSDELHCQKCHDDGGDAGPDIATGTIEGNILTRHDQLNAPNPGDYKLLEHRPVLCGSCHKDNALGTPGDGTSKSLSLAMHGHHAAIMGDQPECYDCHPGAKTQCFRTAIADMGAQTPGSTQPDCTGCHGDLATVANSIASGREPWVNEPTCEQCHGRNYTTGTTLYRESTGHGGVYCCTCHNSPHAWWPSRNNALDNYQPRRLQSNSRSIGSNCRVCHVRKQIGTNPHVSFLSIGT